MSEYISIEAEPTEQPNTVLIRTNLTLAPDGIEIYPDLASGEEGSPLAQTIFAIEGVLALTLDGSEMLIHHTDDLQLFVLVDEIDAALKDFFL
ncbi:MAG: NifU N-terminal domain-containing protein [Anaerolineae bacterium]|nr:NifU N-terminal domain-containing protein [Anaerolineae bacterium]